MNEEQILLLEERYSWTWTELGLQDNYKPQWEALAAAYAGKSRIYHDLMHIFEMVDWLWHNAPYNGDLMALLLWAAFYHDYENTKSKTAEEDSAVRALSVYYAFMPDTQILLGHALIGAQVIQRCILGTKGHESDNEIVQWLIDADLQRFRCPDERYADMIRQEYSEHPDEAFNAGRKIILEKYANRKPFFYHSEGEAEALASINKQLRNIGKEMST